MKQFKTLLSTLSSAATPAITPMAENTEKYPQLFKDLGWFMALQQDYVEEHPSPYFYAELSYFAQEDNNKSLFGNKKIQRDCLDFKEGGTQYLLWAYQDMGCLLGRLDEESNLIQVIPWPFKIQKIVKTAQGCLPVDQLPGVTTVHMPFSEEGNGHVGTGIVPVFQSVDFRTYPPDTRKEIVAVRAAIKKSVVALFEMMDTKAEPTFSVIDDIAAMSQMPFPWFCLNSGTTVEARKTAKDLAHHIAVAMLTQDEDLPEISVEISGRMVKPDGKLTDPILQISSGWPASEKRDQYGQTSLQHYAERLIAACDSSTPPVPINDQVYFEENAPARLARAMVHRREITPHDTMESLATLNRMIPPLRGITLVASEATLEA